MRGVLQGGQEWLPVSRTGSLGAYEVLWTQECEAISGNSYLGLPGLYHFPPLLARLPLISISPQH